MPVPVISVAQMREWEKATWHSGQTEEVVMRQAGRAVARVAECMTREGDLLLALVIRADGDGGFLEEVECKEALTAFGGHTLIHALGYRLNQYTC